MTSQKAVSYARFSSANQREESITAQLRAIRDYAQKRDISIVRDYVDEALSATTDERPQFLQMIDDISTGRIAVDFVFVHKLDRFSRNRFDSAVYRRTLALKNVKLVAVDQPLDDSPESVILEALLEGLAEYYSKNLSREIKKGMKENAMGAMHRGGCPALGYDVVNKKYVINEPEAAIVRRIFQMISDGHTYDETINELNANGYTTKRGQAFGKNSLLAILTNEKYVGNYVAGVYSPGSEIIRKPNEVPAIIEQNVWERVKGIIERRKHSAPRSRGNTVYLLTGKMFCGECGAAYVGNSRKGGRGGEYRYYGYGCVNRKQTKTCSNADISKEAIENYVLDEIESLFNVSNIDSLAGKAEEYYLAANEQNETELSKLRESIKSLQSRIDKLFEAIETESMDAIIAGPRITSLTKEKEAFESRLEELEYNHRPPITREQIKLYLLNIREGLMERSDMVQCRKIIERHVEKVIVHKDGIKVIFKMGKNDDPTRKREVVDNNGGPEGIRTLDLCDANAALSQLSHRPILHKEKPPMGFNREINTNLRNIYPISDIFEPQRGVLALR